MSSRSVDGSSNAPSSDTRRDVRSAESSEPSVTVLGPEPAMIEVHGVSKRYGRCTALRPIDLEVAAGEFVVLSGPSGSGKSTLLNLLAALERPDTGTIRIGDRRLDGRPKHLNRYRRHEVGIVFQLHNLIPRLTAKENVEVAMFSAHQSRRARSARADELLDRLDLADRRNDRPPTMSGGERQRVAVARALANRPPVLLADEPTGSLDTDSMNLVVGLFRELHSEGATIFVVSHDPRIDEFADRQIKMPPAV